MKPTEWNRIPPERKKMMALNLFRSPRGKYIISQALSTAIEDMKRVKSVHREVDNIEDMEMLHEELFPMHQPQIKKKAKMQWLSKILNFRKKRLKEVV